MKRQMVYVLGFVGFLVVLTTAWAMTSRVGYESADYQLIETDGNIEIRKYPELVLAVTTSDLDSQGRDGSFMRLFRYISGDNQAKQKIAMTTPVFMESDQKTTAVSMGFVMPGELAAQGVPEPKSDGVEIRERPAGRFAVIRFAGQLDSQVARKQEAKLREWMERRDLEGVLESEYAGYDPPFTPGPLRRNEVLIRLVDEKDSTE